MAERRHRKIDCSLRKNAKKDSCKKEVGEGSFSITLPKRDNSGQKVSNRLHRGYINRMNRRFNGSTTRPQVLGCFKGSKGRTQCEENIVIESVRDFDASKEMKRKDAIERMKQLRDDFRFMKSLGKDAGRQFGQESIMVQFDRIQDATFVGGKRKSKLSSDKIFDDVFAREI